MRPAVVGPKEPDGILSGVLVGPSADDDGDDDDRHNDAHGNSEHRGGGAVGDQAYFEVLRRDVHRVRLLYAVPVDARLGWMVFHPTAEFIDLRAVEVIAQTNRADRFHLQG